MKFAKYNWPMNTIAALTALVGVLTLSSTLYSLVHLHHARLVIADAHLTLIAGLSLIYLAMLLRRGKYNAWLICLGVYGFLLVRNFRHFVFDDDLSRHYLLLITTNLILPAAMLIALLVWRRRYRVKSETFTFRIAVRRALIILAITFLYGVIGFQLFDNHDFHQEISPTTAAHYTIDQFGLTTHNHPTAYTRRSVFFVDSLASVSIAAAVYVAVAFFAPIRFRMSHHQRDYEDASQLVRKYAKSSEDFFKLWPRDKVYYFNAERSAMIAYHVSRGVALMVGDPLGKPAPAHALLGQFMQLCATNDWRPALIHTDGSNLKFYKRCGLDIQKIGEEALVDINHFTNEVLKNKYFRNINNRFTKAGYSFETAEAPHSQDLLKRLRQISNDWLSAPGRAERGIMMGYFSDEYLQQCTIALLKDSEGQIQAFANQVPTIKSGEANYDFLHSSRGSPSNINDFLMLNFIVHLRARGFHRLNMGLCPLSGLEQPTQQDKTLVDNVLKFAYANGGRFYSFEGLRRFKSKYEPQWEDRFVVYSGGLAGFGRALNALLKAMTR